MSTRYLGLMSGTSLDGVDAALVNIDGLEDGSLRAELEAFLTVPYPAARRARIAAALAGGPAELCGLNRELGDWFAEAAMELLARAGLPPGAVAAVGSHGQTIWHEPPEAGSSGSTLQLGDAAVLAERLGVPIISDFRSRDVAAGGQGAPLVPRIDELLFRAEGAWRVLLNIGGIANLTLLPPRELERPILAFDTGPGIAVIDSLVHRLSEGAHSYDAEGARARAGRARSELVETLLEDPYFAAPPPKSTGRERFGDEYARDLLRRAGRIGMEGNDVIATATALTARSIASARERFFPDDAVPAGCYVSGGGARNEALMEMLAAALRPTPVHDLSALGWDPDAKEAAAFAILAYLHERGEPGNIPSVTGARGPRILGKRTPP